MRVGRTEDNDIVVPERWVSSQHAEIFFRQPQDRLGEHSYVLRDRSRYGTLVSLRSTWRKVHHQEIILQPGMRLKFGSSHGRTLEFLIEMRSVTGL
jgi:pSer/pThr/pTyr-binding forkhead associated (FHA) protein